MSEAISATHEFAVNASITQVWSFIEDFTNWAAYMPGYEGSERVGVDDFVWTLQADLGSFSRTVVIDVHVARWSGPQAVDFVFTGRGEPFSGSGAYVAHADGNVTQVRLALEVLPQGAMAKVIRVLAAPVLPRIASQFAARVTEAIEARHAPTGTALAVDCPAALSGGGGLRAWLARLLRRLFG